MDKKEINKNYQLIRDALASKKVEVTPFMVRKLRDYFNNIVITSIKNKQFAHTISFDDDDDLGIETNNNLIISVNIPRKDIEDIIGETVIQQTLDEMESIVETELENLYEENQINDTGFFFDIDLELVDPDTIKVEIDIEEDDEDDDDDEEVVTRETIENELKMMEAKLPKEEYDKISEITHKIMDNKDNNAVLEEMLNKPNVIDALDKFHKLLEESTQDKK